MKKKSFFPSHLSPSEQQRRQQRQEGEHKTSVNNDDIVVYREMRRRPLKFPGSLEKHLLRERHQIFIHINIYNYPKSIHADERVRSCGHHHQHRNSIHKRTIETFDMPQHNISLCERSTPQRWTRLFASHHLTDKMFKAETTEAQLEQIENSSSDENFHVWEQKR